MATNLEKNGYLFDPGKGGKINRLEVFKQKIQQHKPFYTMDAVPVFFNPTAKLMAILNKLIKLWGQKTWNAKDQEEADAEYTKLTYYDFETKINGKVVKLKLADLSTDPDFGGFMPGEAPGRRAEKRVFVSLEGTRATGEKPKRGQDTGQIEAIKKTIGLPYVPVVIPGINTPRNPYKVTSCVWLDNPMTPKELNELGTLPKADFRLVDDKGNGVLYFSYKDNANVKQMPDGNWKIGKPAPTAFQQYSGISEKVPAINSHQEVKDFIKYCQIISRKKIVKTGEEKMVWPEGKRLACYIEDADLKRKAMFGVGASSGNKKFSIDNCQLVMQGRVEFKSLPGHKNVFSMTASHMVINAGIPTAFSESDPYCPVLAARKGDKRGAFGVDLVRFGIFPKGGSNWDFVSREEILKTIENDEKRIKNGAK